jgi:hypothetical protein
VDSTLDSASPRASTVDNYCSSDDKQETMNDFDPAWYDGFVDYCIPVTTSEIRCI